MQANKTQYGRALAIIPSDTVQIPNIATEVVRSTTTDVYANLLIDANVSFIKLNVKQMAIVYNLTAIRSTTVVNIIDNNTLLLTDDIIGSGDEFVIYNEADIAGCALYIPVKQDENPNSITVKTVGGDIVTFNNLPKGGAILPVNVSMVYTNWDNIVDYIIGLW